MDKVWLTAVAFPAALAAGNALAAEFHPAPHEVWSGTYQCDAIERDPVRWPAYSATIRLVLDDGVAHIVKESARIRETLRGKVGDSGALVLEGAGIWKDGSGTRWRYRFDGQFQGSRFEAEGVMLSAAMSEKLRTCSMKLTRVHASHMPLQAARSIPAKAKTPQAVEAATARIQPPASPSRSEEALQVPALADTSPAASPAPAKQTAVNSAEVTKTIAAAVGERPVTRPASERALASESGWTLRAGWLVLFLALAAIAVVIDRYLFK
jgi:hypothetical protein